MAVATYIGVVRSGLITLIEPVVLPEGIQVYVVMPAVIDERTARRKANRWLIENVGNMLMADHAVLVESDTRPIWRFDAYITALSREPRGPIGYVDVDASNGAVINSRGSIDEMIYCGEHLEPAVLSTDR